MCEFGGRATEFLFQFHKVNQDPLSLVTQESVVPVEPQVTPPVETNVEKTREEL